MSNLSDAVKALENDAQYLRDNLPNFSDPPTADQLKLVEAFIGAIQDRLDRLREVTAGVGRKAGATKRPPRQGSE